MTATHTRRRLMLALPVIVGAYWSACSNPAARPEAPSQRATATVDANVTRTPMTPDLDQHGRHRTGLPAIAGSGTASGAASSAEQNASGGPTPPIKVALLWTSDGGPDHLLHPSGLTVSPSGDLYIVDAGNDRVVVFDADGNVMRAWGNSGDDAGQFRFKINDACRGTPEPCPAEFGGAVATAADELVYIADTGNRRVQVCDPTGRVVAVWERPTAHTGQPWRPTGIVVDQGARVYVNDAANRRLQVFDRAGSLSTTWANQEVHTIELSAKGALAVDPRGDVIVADLPNAQLRRFDAAGRQLPGWRLNPEVMAATIAVARPAGLAINADGAIFLAAGGPYVQQLDASARPVRRWRTDWQEQVTLQQPTGVAVDRHGDIYVADAQAGTICKFRVLTPVDR